MRRLRHVEFAGALLAGFAVDCFAEKIGVAVVPRVLLDIGSTGSH